VFPGQLAGLLAAFAAMVIGSLMPQRLKNRHEPRRPLAA
jgi:SSS family solute:Na+ symporter